MPSAPASASPPTRSGTLLSRIGLDWFFFGLIGVVVLAYLAPGIGSNSSPVPWRRVTTLGVAAIFFLYGLRLSPEKLKAGMRNWRLHAVVQLITFGVFPLLALAVRPWFGGEAGQTLWASVFYLCTLPSTVSTSVVMVSIAGGNLPGAIFNASISSLLGIMLTPLWVSAVLHTGATGGPNLGGMAADLGLQVLLPVVLGVLLHGRFGAWAERHKQGLRLFDQSIILLMVYTSFCESFAENVFRHIRPTDLLLLALAMVALFAVVYAVIIGLSKLLGFSAEDQVTALFCGSKKSLVHGTVMAKVLFAGTAATGVLLLPTMLYHALQILLASVIAQAIGRRMAARRASGT
ncbi:bile acid:sodium symporter [Hymenobacter oligotrophus]|uniref:Bile acid:sodium symporter n=1 Tax=Hymenobacter oligotrophus TaxID=2319843 RepID=A0A3B7R3C5_9BACT|nr:bile acid:sodium symporter family protein [Hymenobacter oligotrophus]AYA36151.1 bile acid:sodium symporter [Hymenobacter oligotrophus]